MDVDKTYAIKDWANVFENYRSRELRGALKYVTWPTKQDSEVFCELSRTEAGTGALGMFGVLVQWAAKAPKRGILHDEKGPLTSDRYALRYGITVECAARFWSILVNAGWLTECENIETSPTAHRDTTDGAPMAHRPSAPLRSNPVPSIPERAENTREKKEAVAKTSARPPADTIGMLRQIGADGDLSEFAAIPPARCRAVIEEVKTNSRAQSLKRVVLGALRKELGTTKPKDDGPLAAQVRGLQSVIDMKRSQLNGARR